MNKYNAYSILLPILLSGCTLPQIKKEEYNFTPPIPKDIISNENIAIINIPNLKWQEYFINKELKELIETALLQNRDLRIAAINVEKAANNLLLAENALKPNLKLNFIAGGNLKANGDNIGNFSTNIGLNNFEIDVFGRLKTLNEQAAQELIAQKHNQSAIKIALIFEISKAFLAINSDLKQIKILNENISSLLETQKIIEARQQIGLSNDLEVNAIKAQLHELNANLLAINSKLISDKNQLNLLMANSKPQEFGNLNSDLKLNIVTIPANIPSNTILNRPDILAAEAKLKAQNANIDFARLQFLPQINLTTSLGFTSSSLFKLLDGGVFNFTPNISYPIFDNGNNKTNLANAILNRNLAIANYDKSIQNSFYELAFILNNIDQLNERIAEQEKAVKAFKASHFIAKERYRIGIDNYLPYLLASRQLNNAELSLLALYDLKNLSFLQFYKSIGIE